MPHPGHRLEPSGQCQAQGHTLPVFRARPSLLLWMPESTTSQPLLCPPRHPSETYDLWHSHPTQTLALPSLFPPAHDLQSIAPSRLALGRGWHPPFVSGSDG